MNLHVFTTGRGTPYGLAAVPVIKVATRSELARRWHDLMDVNAGGIAAGEATIEEIGWELFRTMLDVASGRRDLGRAVAAAQLAGAVQSGADHVTGLGTSLRPRRWSSTTIATPLPAMTAMPVRASAFGNSPQTTRPDITPHSARQ